MHAPNIHASIQQHEHKTTKSTTELFEQDFMDFGYPHTNVSNNVAAFLSSELQA